LKTIKTTVPAALAVLATAAGAFADSPAQPVRSTQYGAERLDFTVGANRAFLILPTHPAPDGSKPWVWYAPSFVQNLPDATHEWMFKQLLAKGFAIGGVDVGESCGNPKGRAAFTAYHDFVVKNYGLSPKACLLPQSRGGLMLINWAVEHPEWVQCIGGIFIVADLTTYPGMGPALNAAYGFKPDDWDTKLAEHNPVDRLAPLAAARIPIFLIHGDADALVPLERNSAELMRRYKALNGPGEIVVINGKGHEVCDEFFKSQRLVDFFLARGW